MSTDEYAVLVLRKGMRDCAIAGDGTLSWSPEAARRTLIDDARAAHALLMQAHKVELERYEAALSDHEDRLSGPGAQATTPAQHDWLSRRDAFMAQCRIEASGSKMRVRPPSGAEFTCAPERVETTPSTRFELANPKPAGARVTSGRPRHPGPPPRRLDEADLLRRFEVDRRPCWSATLTTSCLSNHEVLVVAVESIDPPPAFVTHALNLVAADGWTVHHVAEDREMDEDEVRLVMVRYLLRRIAKPAAAG